MSIILVSCAQPPRFSYVPPIVKPEESAKPVPGWIKPYTLFGKTYYPLPKAEGYEEVCIASWYGPGFHGRQAASGEIYNMFEYTAAHKLLPIGTYVLVTNLENRKQLVVKINDRGPFVDGRCLDLSYTAAKELGIYEKGTALVKIVALAEGEMVDSKIVYKNKPEIRWNEFYFQVGAFKNYSNAIRLKLELEEIFENVLIEPYQHPQLGQIYRVLVFLDRNLNLAYEKAFKLKRDRFRDGFLVVK